jgi:hypothetical protein
MAAACTREGGVQEAAITRPWTATEEELFKSAFLTHFKNFKELATAIGTRSVLEVTKHFYEVRKKDHFKLYERKLVFKKRRDGMEKNVKNAMFGPLSGNTTGAPLRPPPLELQRSAGGASERTPRAVLPPLSAAPRRAIAPRVAAGALAEPLQATAGAAPARRRGPMINPDAFVREARLVGKDVDAIAKQLGCSAFAAHAFWECNAPSLGLDEIAESVAAATDGARLGEEVEVQESWSAAMAAQGLDMARRLTGRPDAAAAQLAGSAAFPKLNMSGLDGDTGMFGQVCHKHALLLALGRSHAAAPLQPHPGYVTFMVSPCALVPALAPALEHQGTQSQSCSSRFQPPHPTPAGPTTAAALNRTAQPHSEYRSA